MSAQPKNTGKEPSTIRLSITLPADEYCELKRLAERNRVSVAIYEEERLNNLKLMTAKMEPSPRPTLSASSALRRTSMASWNGSGIENCSGWPQSLNPNPV